MSCEPQASGHQQSIAWVELGYYLGMALGLMIWKLLGIHLELGEALLIDACFQFIAGFLDYWSKTLPEIRISKEEQKTQNHHQLISSVQWCWRLASAVIFFTIGIQIIIFNSSHHVSETFGSYMIGLFYLGVAAAAYLCNQYQVSIRWHDDNRAYIQTINQQLGVRLDFFSVMSTLAVIGIVYVVSLNYLMDVFSAIVICLFIFVAAFFYELMSLTLLDRLGYEERTVGSSGMIMKTYGLMGLGSAISLWILELMDHYLMSSMITVLVCMFFATSLITKRNLSPNKNHAYQPIEF